VKLNTFWYFGYNFVTSGINFIICYVLSEMYWYHLTLGDNIIFLNMCYLNCTVIILENLGNLKTDPKY
jgi:hypothetical protein